MTRWIFSVFFEVPKKKHWCAMRNNRVAMPVGFYQLVDFGRRSGCEIVAEIQHLRP
jgi:hypothetical protein